jgi:uncharacterized repeat protein (TIGR01451 family)/fimbrial isopeptide formation D2 family protein
MVRYRYNFAQRALLLFVALVMSVQYVPLPARAAGSVLLTQFFSSTSIDVGQVTQLTVTLENTDTGSPASITSYLDDIATMGGVATIVSGSASTTCQGSTLSVSGTQITLSGGTIPQAVSSLSPGTCTVTVNLVGAQVGTGTNTLVGPPSTGPPALVTTNEGNNVGQSTATLNVIGGSGVTVTSTGPTADVYDINSTTVSFTVSNNSTTSLTNVSVPIAGLPSNAIAFTESDNCGTGSTQSYSAASNTETVSGFSLAANSSCTITLTLSVPPSEYSSITAPGSPTGGPLTIAPNVGANSITDAQSQTNNVGASQSVTFINALPVVQKQFFNQTTQSAETQVPPGGSAQVLLEINNPYSSTMSPVSITDSLPAGLTVDAAPNPTSSCGGTFTNTSTQFTASQLSIAPGQTCYIYFTYDVSSTVPVGTQLTNAIATTNVQWPTTVNSTSVTLGSNYPVSATVTAQTPAAGDQLDMEIRYPNSSFGAYGYPQLAYITLTNGGTAALINGSFSETLNQPPGAASDTFVPQSFINSSNFPGQQAAFFTPQLVGLNGATCGGTVSYSSATTLTGTNLTIPANSTCQIEVYTEPTQDTTSPNEPEWWHLVGSTVTFTNAATNATVQPGNPRAGYQVYPDFAVTNYVQSATGPEGGNATVQTVIGPYMYPFGPATNISAVVPLNQTGQTVQYVPGSFQLGSGCPSNATVTPGTSLTFFTVNIPSAVYNMSCVVTYQVTDAGNALGTFIPGTATYQSAQTGGLTADYAGQNNVTFTAPGINVNTFFTPNSIGGDGSSVVEVDLTPTGTGTFTVNNTQVTDDLSPSLVYSASTLNVNYGAGCLGGSGTPSYTIGTDPANGLPAITFSGLTLSATAGTGTMCSITFDVTGSQLGNPSSSIPAGNASGNNKGVTNAAPASATLSVIQGVSVTKSFVKGSLPIGGTDYMRLLITNSSTNALTGGTLTDTMPSSLTLASASAPQLNQAGDPPNCNATIAGANTITLSNITVGAATSTANFGQCVAYVQVTTTASAVAGTVTNTIASGALQFGALLNASKTSAPETITYAAPVTVSKTFTPANIGLGGNSAVSVTITNNQTGAVNLSGLALSDPLPAGLVIAQTPATTNTCGGTVTATAGGTSIALANGALSAGQSCSFGATVTTSATATAQQYTNQINASSLTTTQGSTNTTAATATLTVAPYLNVTKTFANPSFAPGGTDGFTITVNNNQANAVNLSSLAITDTLPSGLSFSGTSVSTTCTGATATISGNTLNVTGGTLAANASCTATATVTGTTPGTYTNTIVAPSGTTPAGVTSAQGSTNQNAVSAPVQIGAATGLAVSKAFAPSSFALGSTTTLTITVDNTAGSSNLTNLQVVDALPTGSGLSYNTTPAPSTTCTGGNVAISGGSTITLSNASLNQGAKCTITAAVTGTQVGQFTNQIAPANVTDTEGATIAQPATANVTVNAPNVTLTKSFLNAQFVENGTDQLTILVQNQATGAVNLSNMSFTDTLPAGLTFSGAGTTTCGGGTLALTQGNTVLQLQNGSVAAGSSCNVVINVTGTLPNSYTNQINAGTLTTGQGATNNAPNATAPVSIIAATGLSVTKSFQSAQFVSGSTDLLTINVDNSAAGTSNLTNLQVIDALPSGLTYSGTAVSNSCGGAVAITNASQQLTLSGVSINAGSKCALTINVTGVTANAYTNSIPVANVTNSQGATIAQAATANVTVVAPNVTLTKAFASSSFLENNTDQLTITISNEATNAANLTNITFSDTLPQGLTYSGSPATTCGTGATFTMTATNLTMNQGTLAAGTNCTVTINVTGSQPNQYTNTINSGTLTSSQGATNNAPNATATVTINTASNLAVSKSFATPVISSGQTSLLTITVSNQSTTASNLSDVQVVDPLPANLTYSGNATTSNCGGASATVTGGNQLTLSNGTLAPSGVCTIQIEVTGTISGQYTNTINPSNVSTSQGATISQPATASLTINAPSVSLSKSFATPSFIAGESDNLTISIANTATNAQALGNLAVSDKLPTGLTYSGTVTNNGCGGTATLDAAGDTVSLAQGALAAGGTCNLQVAVTSVTPNSYTNTIPASAITDTQDATNTSAAVANVTVTAAPNVVLTKSFTASQIVPGGTSLLTITVNNNATGAVALTKMSLSDTLPAGLSFNGAASTTCGGTATITGTTVSLANGAVAAGQSCNVTVNVTGTSPNTYNNIIAAGNVQTLQEATNASPATAALTIANAPNVVLSKSFSPAQIAPGATTQLTINVANTATGAVNLTNVKLSDALPANLAYSGSATLSQCGNGTASVNGTMLALNGASIAASATCVIQIGVTGTSPGSYTNDIPAGTLTSAQGATNNDAQANLQIVVPQLKVTKTSNPQGATVSAGQIITYTVSIVNSGTAAETNARLTDSMNNVTLVPGTVRLSESGGGSSVQNQILPDGVVTNGASFGSIPVGATVVITYSAAVSPNATPGELVTNNVVAAGDQVCSGTACTSASNPNTVGAPAFAPVKLIDGKASETVVTGQIVTYSVQVQNTGDSTANNLVLTDPLPVGMIPQPGTVQVNGVASTSATITGQTITVQLGSLAIGGVDTVTFRAQVAPTAANETLVNVATLTASAINAVQSTQATATVESGALHVTKTANVSVVSVGDRVDYIISVVSPGAVTWGTTTVTDTLPAYEAYAPGTSRVDGKALEPTVSGRVLTWTLPSFSGTLTITYSTAIAPGAQAGSNLTNVVTASALPPGGGSPGTGSATATVQVIASAFGDCFPITGRVYIDLGDKGHFVAGDTGVAGVRVYLEDGEAVTTDKYGRYNFPCVRPGMHALRLDETTLPAGVTAYPDHAIDSERSTRRLVHGIFDDTIIQDINFAVKGGASPPATGNP